MDEELVERCLSDDSEAWRSLIARHRPLVLRILVRGGCRRDPAVVPDLEQKLWLRLLANEKEELRKLRGRPEGALVALLATMALNLARDHGRKLAVRAAVIPEQLAGLGAAGGSEAEGAEEAFGHAELRQQLLAAARAVVAPGEASRDLLIFRCYYADGLTAPEIAALGVGLSVKGVETVIQRLTARVKAHFASVPAASGDLR